MTIAIIAGIVIGVVVGALGGGGAILALPVLVFALGLSPHEGATGSLVIVGITSAVALATHAPSGRVHWRDGIVFGIIGIAGTWLGTALARRVPGQSLLIAFAVLLLVVAFLMWRRARAGAGAGRAVPRTRGNRAVAVMAAAVTVGFLTGFFGVGGGFAVVPALVLALDFPMRQAVATSLFVLTLNTGSALVARAIGGDLGIDWSIVGPFTGAAVLASFLGARIGSRAPADRLQRAFAVLLVGVALYTGLRAVGLLG